MKTFLMLCLLLLSANADAKRPKPVPAPSVLWSAGMEAGNMLEWNGQYNGTNGQYGDGSFTSGSYASDGSFSIASKERAHSGTYSAKLSIPGTGAVRLSRSTESEFSRELYYSAWYFVPQRYTVNLYGWTNWMQFKSWTSEGKNDPFFILDMGNRASGAMQFWLTWWRGLNIEGPAAGQFGSRSWPSALDIPVGRWFRIEVRYVCSGDFTGAVQVWQDGIEIFRFENFRTRYPGGTCSWYVTNYGENITPSPVVIYVDDASISKSR